MSHATYSPEAIILVQLEGRKESIENKNGLHAIIGIILTLISYEFEIR